MARYLNRRFGDGGPQSVPLDPAGTGKHLSALTAAVATFLHRQKHPWQERVPRIVCVDDGLSIRKTVETYSGWPWLRSYLHWQSSEGHGAVVSVASPI
jgi:hypothetical protein